MCYGNITRYSCGHEKRSYFHMCPDGFDENWQVVLSHRLIGRGILCRRLCRECEEIRLAEQIAEDDDRTRHEERAKALLEFLRGERPWPRPDNEVSVTFSRDYREGRRLHPWLNRGNESELNTFRALAANWLPETGPARFQEMLDRQDFIDETGAFLATDLEYRLVLLMERVIAEIRPQLTALREEVPSSEASRAIGTESAQAIRGEQPRLEQIVLLRERLRELLMALYLPESLDELSVANSEWDEADLFREVDRANARRLQEMARLREQIRVAQRTLGVREDNHDAERRLDQALGFIRVALVDGYQLFRQLFIRHGGEFAPSEMMRAGALDLPSRHFSVRWRQLNEFREQIIQELRDGDHNSGAVTRGEAVLQQDTPGPDQPGLYESDPDWLLNFDDWCLDNSVAEMENSEVDLRCDINGWFQHLRNSESPARLDWIPFAETYRDAIQAGDRCKYEYVPRGNDALAQQPLSFRNWCIVEADPAEIRLSPINYTFINLLEGYANYLRRTESLSDLAAFKVRRQGRVLNMRVFLAMIPGAPLSRERNDIELVDGTPSSRQTCADIRRLCRIGPTPNSNYLQRQLDIARLENLRNEAIAVRESRLQIPAGRRSVVERLDVDYFSLRDLNDDLSGPAGRNYNEWQMAAEESRAQMRARRDESDNEPDDAEESAAPPERHIRRSTFLRRTRPSPSAHRLLANRNRRRSA